MIPLPDKPKIVLFWGTESTFVASNISPDIEVVITSNEDWYKQNAQGLPFEEKKYRDDP